MSFRDEMTHVASRDEMRPAPTPWDFYRDTVDALIVACTPDGQDASLDGPEWIALRRAFANKVPAETIARQIMQAREWTEDPNDTLMIALRMSAALSAVESRLKTVQAHNDQIANFVQALPQREEFDALLAENQRLRDDLRALSLQRVA